MSTILVVDDDTDTCRNMADLFGDLGYAIETAESGQKALRKREISSTISPYWTCGCRAWTV